MNSILIAMIISVLFQNLLGYLKFKKIINPIFLFSIIHFFHNWSFSFSRHFNELQLWNANLSVEYWSMYDVLFINFVGSWVFFFIIILLAKTKKYRHNTSFTETKKLLNGYYILSFFSLINFYSNYDPTLAYGANQASDAISAFNPLSQVIFFRVIMCITYIFLNKPSKKTILKIILIELFFSAINFKRKDLILIVSSLLIKNLINKKIKILPTFRYSLFAFFGTFFVTLIPIYRSVNNYVDGFFNVFNEVIYVISDYGSQIFLYIINLTNSEGVQNWTYQLVHDGEMTLLYGKSYLQGVINMFILRPFQGSTIANWQGAYYFKSLADPDNPSQGWDFTFTAEAIQNFGPRFSFISYGILGLFIANLYSKRNKGDLYKILYLFTWPVLIIGFRMDSTSVFRLYSYILLLYLYFYLSKNIKKIDTY